MKTEKDLQNYLRKECIKRGVLYYKVQAVSQRGFPDCFLAYDGKTLLVELKSPAGTGRLSPLQITNINKLVKQKVWVEVVASVKEVDDLLALLTV